LRAFCWQILKVSKALRALILLGTLMTYLPICHGWLINSG
jgi:hypothetical protein